MYKGKSLAHTRAEPARAGARARYARVLPCGVQSSRPKGGAFRSPLGLPPSAMRHDVLVKSSQSPSLTLGASCLLRAVETPALRRQGDASGLRGRVITSLGHSLAALARPISRSSGVNDHAALLRSRSAGLGSPAALSCRVSMSAACRVAVVALRCFVLPHSAAQGCGRWPQRPYGARVGAKAPRGSLRSPRRYVSAICGLPSIFCDCGAVALSLKYR